MLWTPDTGVHRRKRHMERLQRSARRLGIAPVGVDAVLKELRGDGPLRVRLTVDAKGSADVTTAPFQPLAPGSVWRIAMSEARLSSEDPWLSVKSTMRALYDETRANLPTHVDEMVFLNQDGALCEGTITNIFVARDDILLTPSLECGALPGILREELIENGRAREARLDAGDLARAEMFFVGNALRGLIPARMV
ncbi:aminotransferase class IV family protein [Roseovarius aestuariivivens]|uniref:aminotransferase class IV family protein n=1 Tax=Roseovarius aestuariivivens TaxID=1888910 RepID=UPI001FDA92D8|nr:aminotransferase class IV family protein [Roseovarius aestuariivivens]